jgi:hypothetical protein
MVTKNELNPQDSFQPKKIRRLRRIKIRKQRKRGNGKKEKEKSFPD